MTIYIYIYAYIYTYIIYYIILLYCFNDSGSLLASVSYFSGIRRELRPPCGPGKTTLPLTSTLSMGGVEGGQNSG